MVITIAGVTEVRNRSKCLVFTNGHFPDDYDHHREVFETPEQKLRLAIIKLGEVVSRFSARFIIIN